MWLSWNRYRCSARRALIRSLFTSTLLLAVGCRSVNTPDVPGTHSAGLSETIIYETDSTEWHVCIIARGLTYENAVAVYIPAPWALPTQEDANILKDLNYPNKERFVTSDGYTFGMPSSTVSKAGAKTKYSTLGLWKRKTIIVVEF